MKKMLALAMCLAGCCRAAETGLVYGAGAPMPDFTTDINGVSIPSETLKEKEMCLTSGQRGARV